MYLVFAITKQKPHISALRFLARGQGRTRKRVLLPAYRRVTIRVLPARDLQERAEASETWRVQRTLLLHTGTWNIVRARELSQHMDRRPGSPGSKQYVRVEEARHRVSPARHARVAFLERKDLRMSESSRSSDPDQQKQQQQRQPQPPPSTRTSQQQQQQQLSSESEKAVAGSSRTSTTQSSTASSPGVSSGAAAPSSSSHGVETPRSTTSATATTETKSPAAATPRPAATATSLEPRTASPRPGDGSALERTSPVAAPFIPPKSPQLSPRLRQRSSHSTTAPAVATTTTTPTLAAATGQAQPQHVGGKRPPTGEDSPIIVLTEHVDNQQLEEHPEATRAAAQEVPDPGLLRKRQEPTKHEPHKPDPSSPQVSTPTTNTSRSSTGTPSTSSSTSAGRGREPTRSKPAGVQFSLSAPVKRDVAHVMEFFQEQEKSLQQSFLSLPKRPVRKQRSPSPHVQQPSMGLEHLDNLIKLMEQLASLKDENSRLQKRCDYLESTKVLLQAKQDLSFESSSSSSGFLTLPSEKSSRHSSHHSHHHQITHRRTGRSKHSAEIMTRLSSEPGVSTGVAAVVAGGDGGGQHRMTRPRLSSADDLEYLEDADSCSDQRPKRSKSMHKRSFSTGSLEVPSEFLEQVNGMEGRKRMKSKTGRSIFGGKHSGSKQKSKSSKWARVKKVLTGQKLYEDLGTTIRSLRELGKSTSHVRYSTSGIPTGSHEASAGGQAWAHRHRFSTQESGPGGRAPLSLPQEGKGSTGQPSPDADTDLSSDIWMGPPDWWEDYEAHRDSGGTSTTSDVSSVIEVTTMYLGKKETTQMTSAVVTTARTASLSTSTTSPMTTSATSTSSVSSGIASGQERFLKVESSLPRRQSSPSLSAKEGTTEEEEDLLDDLTLVSAPSRFLHKSSSCKSADLDLPKELSISPKSIDGREAKKFHKTAWGRVKDIIHTRKDSIKKKPKRERSSGFDSEETSEVDVEGLEEQWRSDSFGEGLLGRSTPKTSPTVTRQGTTKGFSESPPPTTSTPGGVKTSASRPGSARGPGNVDVAALLAGSVSDEFTRKMQEWEEKRARKTTRSIRASMDDSEMASLDMSGTSQDLHGVRTVDLRDLKGKVPDLSSEGPTPEESTTSMEVQGAPSINVEELMQRRMTESFSRKMQEWERLKYRGGPLSGRDASPDIERKGSKGRKEERQKSRRSKEDKEKEKWERQRERDKQKVEREQVKLEKEKLRIEKERLRALEREAKLEKLKGRLSQSEVEPYRNPVLSPLAEYKVTADFARKLHEWELMKGLSHDVSNSIYLEAQKMSMEHLRETGQLDPLSKNEQARLALEGGVREGSPHGAVASPPSDRGSARSEDKRSVSSAPPPVPPLTLQPYWDSPEETSPIERYHEDQSLVEEDEEEEEEDDEEEEDTVTSVTEELLTKSNIATMERANTQLLAELQKKELEYAAVQTEVSRVNEKLDKVRDEHAREMARFHRELAEGSISGPVKLEVGDLQTTMGELEEKIKLMENFGEKLAMSMESAAVGKVQSIEGEEGVHTQLVELVEQMRGMLIQASQSEEQSQKSMALSNFETLYSQAMKLQVQMNNLRLSHLERNREIMMIKRQLLLQEVNNLLLQADITRRETELFQFQEARRFALPKRWNTFSGTDRQRPQAQMELASVSGTRSLRRDLKGKLAEPRVNIPYIAEDVLLASAASSSLSAPASPSAIAAAGGLTPPLPITTTGQSHSSISPAGSRDRSTDHVERHLLSLPRPGPGRGEGGGASRVNTLQLPSAALRVQTSTSSLSPSPYSSATPSPLSSPALDTTPTSPLSPDDSMELSTTLTTTTVTEGNTSVTESGETTIQREPQQQPPSSSSGGVPGDAQRKSASPKPSKQPEFMTLSDSAPLHLTIEELKRQKSKVAKGSPTLKKQEDKSSAPVPSPGWSSRLGSSTPETPHQTIPKQRSLDKPRLTKAAPIIDDDYSPTLSVMECTDHVATYSEPGAVGGTEPPPSPSWADPRPDYLPPTSDHQRPGSRSPRSPVSKHRQLRRQREQERETKMKDYKAISPKGSPIATRGKPPLPRQVTPVKQSPSASPATPEKGPRSKSVGDMDPGAPDSPSTRQLQDAINKFEKRATVCETEDRPLELRKTPSPTLHLPRVGLVSRVRRLKPAAELLEESQRYRSGQSIYATRILQKYMQKEESKSSGTTNKENTSSGTYVHAIVQRLSRETTPIGSAGSSRSNSNVSLHRTEASSKTRSDLVSSLVRQLSSTSSGPDSPKAPLKDLTNDGQVKQLMQAFNGKGSPDRTLSESDIEAPKDPTKEATAKAQKRKSCEVAMVLASAASPPTEASYGFASSGSVSGSQVEEPGPSNHKSLPILAPPREDPAEEARARAATYCAPEEAKAAQEKAASTSKQRDESSKRGKSKDKRQSKSRERKGLAGRLLSSSLSPERGAKGGKMGTVGVLCKQSISFDLGVTLYGPKSSSSEAQAAKARKPRSWDPSESAKADQAAQAAAAASAGSEPSSPGPSSPGPSSPGPSSQPGSSQGATASGRPVSSTSSEGDPPLSPGAGEKKKSRRFLDSSWLQKSKKFFKVSK